METLAGRCSARPDVVAAQCTLLPSLLLAIKHQCLLLLLLLHAHAHCQQDLVWSRHQLEELAERRFRAAQVRLWGLLTTVCLVPDSACYSNTSLCG